jgi:hypothetical protein
MEWPIPPDVTLVDCAGWEGDYSPRGRHFSLHEPFTSYATFELPIASDKLFLLARGMAAGAVKVRYGSDSNDVKIAVEARYRLQEALDNVRVCTITRGEGENGLGIFVSRFLTLCRRGWFLNEGYQGPEWTRRNVVHFDVTLYLPNAEEGSLLEVKNFETDVPLFAHDIGDLEGSVFFDTFKLKSANVPIVVKVSKAPCPKTSYFSTLLVVLRSGECCGRDTQQSHQGKLQRHNVSKTIDR